MTSKICTLDKLRKREITYVYYVLFKKRTIYLGLTFCAVGWSYKRISRVMYCNQGWQLATETTRHEY